jgi:hypothetical protein
MFFERRSKLGIAGLHGATARGGSENQASDQSRPNRHVHCKAQRPPVIGLTPVLSKTPCCCSCPQVESAPPPAMRVRGSSPKPCALQSLGAWDVRNAGYALRHI